MADRLTLEAGGPTPPTPEQQQEIRQGIGIDYGTSEVEQLFFGAGYFYESIAATKRTIHVSMRDDGRDGRGSAADPRDGSSPEKLDAIIQEGTEDTLIQLGPGTFLTNGTWSTTPNAGIQLEDNAILRGSGIGVTTLQPASGCQTVAGGYYSLVAAKGTGATVECLTLDCMWDTYFTAFAKCACCTLTNDSPAEGAPRWSRCRFVEGKNFGGDLINNRESYPFFGEGPVIFEHIHAHSPNVGGGGNTAPHVACITTNAGFIRHCTAIGHGYDDPAVGGCGIGASLTGTNFPVMIHDNHVEGWVNGLQGAIGADNRAVIKGNTFYNNQRGLYMSYAAGGNIVVAIIRDNVFGVPPSGSLANGSAYIESPDTPSPPKGAVHYRDNHHYVTDHTTVVADAGPLLDHLEFARLAGNTFTPEVGLGSAGIGAGVLQSAATGNYTTDGTLVFEIAAVAVDYDTRWVVMSDWHYAEEFGRGGNQRCRDGYRKLGDHRPSLGVSCGDLISMNLGADHPLVDYRLFRQIKALSGCPWLHCVGNHEIGITPPVTDEDKQARQRAFFDGVQDFYTENHIEFGQIPFTHEYNDTNRLAYPGNESNGVTYWAPPFDPQLYPQPGHQPVSAACYAVPLPEDELASSTGYYAMRHLPTGVTHIVLNTAYDSGAIGATQRAWLENEVIAKLDASDRIVLYMHHGNGYMAGESQTWLIGVLTAFTGKTLALFSGHTHGDAHYIISGLNFITLDDGESHKSKPYTDPAAAVDNSMAYYLCRWDEDSSTFHIDGYDGGSSYELTI